MSTVFSSYVTQIRDEIRALPLAVVASRRPTHREDIPIGKTLISVEMDHTATVKDPFIQELGTLRRDLASLRSLIASLTVRPIQFCLYPDQYSDVLLLRRVYDDTIGHFGPIFWSGSIPHGFAIASALHNITTLAQQDAVTQADIGLLTPQSLTPPCATDGSTVKCEFCRGGCQDWRVAINVSSLENERSHWRVPNSDVDVLLYRSHNRVLYASVRPTVAANWPSPTPTNITDDVANFNAGNFPTTNGLDGRPYLVSNAMITLLRDPLFLSTASDGYGFTTVAAIGSCEDNAVFASPVQPWGCLYREPGGSKEGGLQYPQALIVTEPSEAQGFYVVVSLNKEDIWIARTPLNALPGYVAAGSG